MNADQTIEGQAITSAAYGIELPERYFTIDTTHDHKSGLGIYAKATRVRRYADVRETAERMILWLNANNGHFPSPYVTAYAISHCQVASDPWQMFVVSKDLLDHNEVEQKQETRLQNHHNFFFKSQAIFNAEILEAPEKIPAKVPKRELVHGADGKVSSKITVKDEMKSNRIFVPDACMSFPQRKQKNTERYYRIKVRYQIKGLLGFKTITEWVEGLKAHIFQHEIDHANAINIYYGKKNA